METNEIIALLEEVKERCDEAKISYQDDCSFSDGDSVDLTIHMPCGRETRNVYLMDEDDLQAVSIIKFEELSFIAGYEAICNYQVGTIEALLLAPPEAMSAFLGSRVLARIGITTQAGKGSSLTLKDSGATGLAIKIARKSATISALTSNNDKLGLSISITGCSIADQEAATKLLERTANAVLFDIEHQKGLNFNLIRKSAGRRRLSPIKNDGAIEFPRNEYEAAPMALYWYARSATNMPLLQFLALYQVIEFYYPTYYNAELSRKIKSVIKSPSFRADRETDLARLISIIKSKGGGNGSEREQLRATLKECLANETIEEFLAADEERAKFFLSKAKGISSSLINPQNKQTELYIQVSDRVYEVRCKIVHTKGDEHDGELELLLPYSKEAEKLGYDIELIRFVAQSVLICSAKAFA